MDSGNWRGEEATRGRRKRGRRKEGGYMLDFV